MSKSTELFTVTEVQSRKCNRVLRLRLVAFLLLNVGCFDRSPATKNVKQESATEMSAIQIEPGESIGGLRLGQTRAQLPSTATLTGSMNEFQGIKFQMEKERIVDVWIDDLRTFEREVQVSNQSIARDISLQALKTRFGPCERVTVKGGVFFNCAAGITIGCDFEEQGQFIQLRLKAR